MDVDKTATIQQLFKDNPTPNDLVIEDGQTLTQAINTNVQSQGKIYSYANPIVKKYYQIRNADYSYKTLATFATFLGMSITNNFSTTFTAKSFQFIVSKARDIKSSMFLTIFTDRGIYLMLPQRINTSNFISNTSYSIDGSSKNLFTNFSFEGETLTADYQMSLPVDDTVRPTLLDSTIKTMISNVEKSKQDVIFIRTGQPLNPMDYIIENGNNYLVVSQKRDKTQNLYTCVREQVGTYTFTGSDIDVPSKFYKQIMIINDTKAAGTDGGTFTNGADRTRVINTTDTNTISGASLSSNQVTLPAGTYSIYATAPAFFVDAHIALWYNVTDSVLVKTGSEGYSGSSGNYATTISIISGIFAITKTTVFELRHRCNTSQVNNGFGVGTNLNGNSCNYSQIKIEKL